VKKLALLFALIASPALAQTIELKAGDSSLLDASGGSVVFYLPSSTVELGAGVSGGRFVGSATEHFETHGFDIYAGDRQLFLTTGSAGLSLAERGVEVERKSAKQTISFFAGATGQAYSAPFFSGIEAHEFGAGYSYRRELPHGFDFASVGAVAGNKRTGLESLAYRWRAVKIFGTAGYLENREYLNGNAALQFQHFSANASRQTYLYKEQRTTVDSFSAAARIGALDFSAADFSGRTGSGQSFGAGARVSIFDVRTDYFHSAYGGTISGSLSERISRRFSFSQYLTRAAGRTAINYGGSYSSNVATVSVGWTTAFVPLAAGRSPFQQVLSVSISLQLPHSISASAQTVTAPDGSVKFSVYGSGFTRGPLAASGPAQARSIRGRFKTAVHVIDRSGEPVEGAAVRIGKDLVITDGSGRAWIRARKAREQRIGVEIGEFTAPGTWRVVTAPASAVPVNEDSAEALEIVVERAQ